MESFFKEAFERIGQKIQSSKININETFRKVEEEICTRFENVDSREENFNSERNRLLEVLGKDLVWSLDKCRDCHSFARFFPSTDNITPRLVTLSYKNDFDIAKKLKYYEIFTKDRIERFTFLNDCLVYCHMFALEKSKFILIDSSNTKFHLVNDKSEVIKTLNPVGKFF